MLHGDERDALALLRVGRREVVGMQIVGDELGLDREEALEVLEPSRNERSVSQFCRSPMWWPTQARSPCARQKVLLSSAPQAEDRPRAAAAAACWPGT